MSKLWVIIYATYGTNCISILYIVLFESKKVFILIVVIKTTLALKIIAVVRIRQSRANITSLAISRINHSRMMLEHGELIMKVQTH